MNEQYYADKAISQTALKALVKGVHNYNKFLYAQEAGGLFYSDDSLFYKESPGIVLGDALDFLLTYGQTEFDNTFGVITVEKPGEKPMSICQQLLEDLDITIANMKDSPHVYNFSTFKNDVIKVMDSVKYRGNIKDEDKRLGYLQKDAGDYWKCLVNTIGKKIIDFREYQRIKDMEKSLTTHFRFAPIVNQETDKSKGVQVINQFSIKWVFDGIACKSLLDKAIINHKNKTVYLYDYKVTFARLDRFHNVALKLRYDFQAAFYTEAVKYYLSQNGLDNYEIKPFMFIVINYNSPKEPILLKCSEEVLDRGRNGGVNKYGDKIEGFVEAVERFKWHDIENNWETEKEIIENNNTLIWEL